MKKNKNLNLKKLALSMLAGLGMLGGIQQAGAVVSDTVYFRALPMVIVWGANNYAESAGTAPIVSDFYLLTGASGTVGSDIIAGNVFPVVTGTLNPVSNGSASTGGTLLTLTGQTSGGLFTDNAATGVLNAADTLTAFGINNTTTLSANMGANSRSFYVASNSAFDIYAQAGTVTGTGDFSTFALSNLNMNMSLTTSGTDGSITFGGSAQAPTSGGSGFVAMPVALNTLSTASKVFDGGRRTAASAGSIAAQSVRFNVSYNLVGGYGLQMGAGTVSVPMTYTVYVP